MSRRYSRLVLLEVTAWSMVAMVSDVELYKKGKDRIKTRAMTLGYATTQPILCLMLLCPTLLPLQGVRSWALV